MKNNSLSQLLYSLATATGIAFGMASIATAQPVDGPLGADASARTSQAATAQPRRNVAHSTLPTTFAGKYVLTKEAAADSYNGVAPEAFGTTTVMLPDGNPSSPTYGQLVPTGKPVRDLHYVLERDAQGRPTKVGMRMIPVSEPHFEVPLDEEPDPKKPGSNLIDRFIRKTQGLSASDPIFAIIVYLHPEKHSGDVKQLASEALKTEHGQTHLGMYFGKGFTRNSPETYHSRGWEISGYPATVQLVSLEGTDQATLNRNGEIAAAILNNGVQFPNDYKNDVYQTITLGRTLAFYKGWLKDDPKLKTDNAWKTYCAEHVTIVTNIMVNVPHNEASFTEIWGAEGPELLKIAKAKFKAATGREMTETSFEPLWKKDGLSDPAKLGIGDEVAQKDIGPGLAWPPQHNSDLLKNFLEVYASWPEVGAPASAAALLGFKEKLMERMLNTEQSPEAVQAEAKALSDAFDQVAIPVISKMFVFEAMTKKRSELKAYAAQSNMALYVAIGGKPEDLLAGGTPDPQRMGLVKLIKKAVVSNKEKIIAGSEAGTTVPQAYAMFQQAISSEVEAARRINVSNPNKVVRYNSPPAVTHRVASGLHPSHSKVKIVEVATVFEASELQPKPEAEVAAPPSGDDPGAAGRLNGLEGGSTGEETPAVETPAVETPAEETPAAETPAQETPSVIRHRVVRGDTLSGLSVRYGVSIKAIKRANRRTHDTIYRGETLIIPSE